MGTKLYLANSHGFWNEDCPLDHHFVNKNNKVIKKMAAWKKIKIENMSKESENNHYFETKEKAKRTLICKRLWVCLSSGTIQIA